MRKHYFYTLAAAMAITFVTQAQQSDLQTLPLTDLSAFQNQAGNWRVVGDVTMDRTVDTHHEVKPAPAEPAKKGKKTKKEEEPAPAPKAVSFVEGNGVLLNINDDVKKDQLVTKMQHGDLELELEVMLPKGSNSGIYLQGRYEVQLLDSWGVKTPKFSDIGGIYRNWETTPGKIYMGKAPLTNAAKAPGLWQKLKISFKAPRFDSNGNKIANATFTRVELNGVTIHQNVEVPLPTGGPIENNEKAMGPLVIQGDHGPVAFRNIRFKELKELEYKLSPVTYTVYHGNFKSVNDFATVKPSVSGSSNSLSCEILDIENNYGADYKGTITVPEDADYSLIFLATGGSKFIFDNKEILYYPVGDGFKIDTSRVALKAGTYPFEIMNFKTASWMPPALGLFIKSANSDPKPIHALNSLPPSDNPVSSIYLEPGKSPRLIRAFIDFKGNRKERLTHTIGVGDPIGIHYVYDLKAGNLVCVWKGDFVDATPMWHDRGDGSFRPRGFALFLFNNEPLAYLSSDKEFFPTVAKDTQFKGKGYDLDEAGRPLFHYTYEGLELDDRIYPDDNNQVISHEVVLRKGERKDGLYYKLAEGSSIQEMPDGSYAINDKEYYVKVQGGVKPFIRDGNGKKELVIGFPSQSLKYSIIW